MYNLSMVSNQTGIVEIIQKVNTELMRSQYGNMALITIGAILFMAFMYATADPKKSIAATSFICFIMSIFFRAMDIIPDLTIYITLVITGISAAFLIMTK